MAHLHQRGLAFLSTSLATSQSVEITCPHWPRNSGAEGQCPSLQGAIECSPRARAVLLHHACVVTSNFFSTPQHRNIIHFTGEVAGAHRTKALACGQYVNHSLTPKSVLLTTTLHCLSQLCVLDTLHGTGYTGVCQRNMTVRHIRTERESLHWFLHTKTECRWGKEGPSAWPLLTVGCVAVTSHIRLPGSREGAVPKPFMTRDRHFPWLQLCAGWPEMSFVREPFSLRKSGSDS